MGLVFEWDIGKARENVRKHGVSFEEARTVFADVLSLTIPDPSHSNNEVRWIQLGMSSRRRLLVVSCTERVDCIRIISSRVATKRERRQYEESK